MALQLKSLTTIKILIVQDLIFLGLYYLLVLACIKIFSVPIWLKTSLFEFKFILIEVKVQYLQQP